jgi:hypothetical protein
MFSMRCKLHFRKAKLLRQSDQLAAASSALKALRLDCSSAIRTLGECPLIQEALDGLSREEELLAASRKNDTGVSFSTAR